MMGGTTNWNLHIFTSCQINRWRRDFRSFLGLSRELMVQRQRCQLPPYLLSSPLPMELWCHSAHLEVSANPTLAFLFWNEKYEVTEKSFLGVKCFPKEHLLLGCGFTHRNLNWNSAFPTTMRPSDPWRSWAPSEPLQMCLIYWTCD